MKKLFCKLGFILFYIIQVGCEKDANLPPATMEGLGSFGMLVNDQIWTANGPITFDGNPALYIQYSPHLRQLVIKASNVHQEKKVIFFVDNVGSIGFYKFSKKDNIRAQDTSCYHCLSCTDSTIFTDLHECVSPYKLVDSVNSSIQLTRLDTLGKIVSGTFTLALKNSANQTLNIKNGRFDARY